MVGWLVGWFCSARAQTQDLTMLDKYSTTLSYTADQIFSICSGIFLAWHLIILTKTDLSSSKKEPPSQW